jgi:hypothetical protein
VHNLHLWPVSGPCQEVIDWAVQVPGHLHEQPRVLGNRVHGFTLRAGSDTRDILIRASGRVRPLGVSCFLDDIDIPPAFFRHASALAEPNARMTQWATGILGGAPASQPDTEQLLHLLTAVSRHVRYRPGNTGVETTALEAFDWGLGVCQDQAHVMVAICRGLGWPARYVSGYFHAVNQPELASHAWVDVCVDETSARWLSLDVTHACPTDERHVRLAAGIDYTGCMPVRGLRRGGGDEVMDVQIRIAAEASGA